MRILVFDTETTGLVLHPSSKDSVQPRIIEWGGCLVDETGAIIDELNLLINPGCALPPEITKITGITEEDLADKPSFREVAEQIQWFFANAELLIAHNLPFDHAMMDLELARNGLADEWQWPRRNLCTVQEHAEEWGRRPKLTELYEFYLGEKLAQTHRAIDDVHALVKVCVAAGVLK